MEKLRNAELHFYALQLKLLKMKVKINSLLYLRCNTLEVYRGMEVNINPFCTSELLVHGGER